MSHRLPAAALGAVAVRLTVDAGELMHALQGERSASVLHIVSPGRRRTLLERTWTATDNAAGALRVTVAAIFRLGRIRAERPTASGKRRTGRLDSCRSATLLHPSDDGR